MFVGTGVELLLLGHYEDSWQIVPLALIGAGLLGFVLVVVKGSRWVVKIFQLVMLLCLISGFIGTWFHLEANREFELEMYPNMKGWELISETFTGAIPALAPGSMIVLGLLGLLFIRIKTNQIDQE